MVSRSGYYDWLKRCQCPGPRQRENLQLRQRIKEQFVRHRQAYGSPRIKRALGIPISRKRVARLMRQERIWARLRSKYRVPTTDSRHGGPIAPNLLGEFKATKINQAWVTDSTAVLTAEGWLHVVALLDVYSRRVVGWAMHATLDAGLAVRALQMAIANRRPPAGLLVHSDRGSQFASADFRAVLAQNHLVASMSRKGNCYDNAHIESFWSTLKYETVYHRKFTTRADARAAIFDYIEAFYNRVRMHSSLGYISLVAFESRLKSKTKN